MEIKIPEVGESIREALLAKWFKKTGDSVVKDEPLCEIETDKITLDLNADDAGVLSITVPEGTTVAIGATIGTIDEGVTMTEVPSSDASTLPTENLVATASSPSARREMREHNIDPDDVNGTGKGGRITLGDLFTRIEERSKQPAESKPAAVLETPPEMSESQVVPLSPVSSVIASQAASAAISEPARQDFVRTEEPPAYTASREERRPMSPIRKRIAERLVSVRQQTAMLTTFNEADLTQIKTLRNTSREHFQQRHGIALGYMPFFVKACVEALKEFPTVNASIDRDDVVYHHFYDIGIAIGGEKGLVVPVLRNADHLKLYEIEQAITGFTEKIRSNLLTIADLEGGTFSISNGGVYGSMLSTPILNPPQSAVLGMHAIQDRPVVRDGQIVVRPMMYLALSYDHRLIDGREAVNFLKKVKEYIQDPEELLLEG